MAGVGPTVSTTGLRPSQTFTSDAPPCLFCGGGPRWAYGCKHTKHRANQVVVIIMTSVAFHTNNCEPTFAHPAFQLLKQLGGGTFLVVFNATSPSTRLYAPALCKLPPPHSRRFEAQTQESRLFGIHTKVLESTGISHR